MQLTGRIRKQSAVDTTVFFTVRYLNQIQRARRDMAILSERAEYARITEEKGAELEAIWGSVKRESFPPGNEGDEQFGAARREKYEAAPVERRAKADMLHDRQELLFRSVLLPATIRAALVQIEGLQVDSKQILTVEDFLDVASDELVDEAWNLCNGASGLTPDQQKN